MNRTEFWSISYPLGEVAKSILRGEDDGAVALLDALFENRPQMQESYEKSDRRYTKREYDFESFLFDKSPVELPVDKCKDLWLAHKALDTVYGANYPLCYYALNKLKTELMHVKRSRESD